MSEYVFVYGSLKPGFGGEEARKMVSLLRHVGSAKVAGRLYDFGEYCGAILDEARDEFVKGELLEIPTQSVLRKLDQYEEYDPRGSNISLFVRQRVQATLQTGEIVQAWIYVYNGEPGDAPIIKSGEYQKKRTN